MAAAMTIEKGSLPMKKDPFSFILVNMALVS